jgi:hypothetical protein
MTNLDSHGKCSASPTTRASLRPQSPRFASLTRNGVSGGREDGAMVEARSRSPASSALNKGSGMGWMLCRGALADFQGPSGGTGRDILTDGAVKKDWVGMNGIDANWRGWGESSMGTNCDSSYSANRTSCLYAMLHKRFASFLFLVYTNMIAEIYGLCQCSTTSKIPLLLASLLLPRRRLGKLKVDSFIAWRDF